MPATLWELVLRTEPHVILVAPRRVPAGARTTTLSCEFGFLLSTKVTVPESEGRRSCTVADEGISRRTIVGHVTDCHEFSSPVRAKNLVGESGKGSGLFPFA